LSQRLIHLFLPDATGRRPFQGAQKPCEPYWQDHLLFHEYFHGENGKGLGASHQTGWTGLVAMLLQQQGMHDETRETADTSPTGLLRAPTGYHQLDRR
jgi:hypothetical protein